MKPALVAFLGAASLVSAAAAQDVPAPPPAGVLPTRPRVVPMTTLPDSDPQQAPSLTETLPQLPENPIKLEDERPAAATPQPDAVELTPHQMDVTGPASRKPVKPAGPVYFFATTPEAYAATVMAPPAMHVPNSPFVEDLSVAGDHGRYPYYSYRRPWYTPGQLNANVTIVW